MTKIFSGRFSKHIAWFLLVIFYGELAGTLYASGGSANYTDFRLPVRRTGLMMLPQAEPAGILNSDNQHDPVIEKPAGEIVAQTDEAPVAIDHIDKKDEADKLNIGGPGQPEMSSFKSVGSDNMVNLFTGDFSYNIPLGDVAGFPINIFYNAGASMDQEASWVGLGWNLNAGTISRNMRGLPDDYSKSDTITKIQSIKPDRTIGATANKTIELLGAQQNPDLTFTSSFGIFYNNRRGLGLETGGKLDYNIYDIIQEKNKTPKDTLSKATTTISGGIDLNSQNGMSMSLGFDHYKEDYVQKLKTGYGTSIGFNSRTGLTDIGISAEYKTYKDKKLYDNDFAFTHSSNISFARSSYTPSIQMPVTRSNYSYSLRFGKERTGFFRNGSIRGYVQESRIASQDTLQRRPAYGFMYYDQANKNPNALLDFNRLNDRVFTKKTPVMAIPVYTYDVYTISGEGTGGTFRGYRGNIGHMRDHVNQTRNGSLSLQGELGAGGIFHAGVNIGGMYSPTFVRDWKIANTLGLYAQFNKTDSNYQSFYFKNPAEKAIIDQGYYEAMGGDKMIRPYLGSPNSPAPYLRSSFQVYNNEKKVEGILPITATNNYRGSRDKRTQVITCLTAEEASLVGLDKMIYSYKENLFKPISCGETLVRTPIMRYDPDNPRFYRKADHVSSMEVLEGNGQRYIYGIPVYQVNQQEVSFSTSSTPTADNLVPYTPGLENTTKNDKGRDGFYQREIMDGYAHSYLLTAILSPDYVDVTGDGISDDDLGTAIKINYSRVDKKSSDGKNYWNTFKWRMPVDKNAASYNEGLKADSRDDKGLYTYGEKELWFMHSIESKNMVATFHTSDRLDGLPVKGENGEANKTTGAGRLKKLDKIQIFTKAEYNKENPVPIKTIKFNYSYRLCRNYALNENKGTNYEASGKLTLDEITCSYNGNVNQNKNRYLFKYAETSGTNPDYKPVNNDRWGNYKDVAGENPAGMNNQDFPYTLQQAETNTYAGAWNLERILLPSGGVMKVEYEADDYGYVQDKRACQMTSIVGFSNKSNGENISNKLYKGFDDYCYVYFDAGQTLTSVPQVREKYLQDFKQLLLKLWVKMPKGNVGNSVAYEPVIVYGVIDEVGINTNNTNQFYVRLEKTRKGKSPMMETIIEFLKEQLPARAYPGYEVNGDGGVLQVIRAVFGLMMSFKQGVLGFERELRGANKCQEVDLAKSFARLNTANRKKLGGGYRVKKITVRDNWHTMTNDSKTNRESVYGQAYSYTTTEEIGGQKVTISSGVASYEPGIGNEENPFREILKYEEKQFLGPTSFNNIELPVAETFFPSPSVGYSKVTVRSIHTKETHDNKNLKSPVGMQQTEFFTTRDFPVISEFTSFDADSRANHQPNIIKKIFNFDKRDYLTLTQGFRIVLNDMNGKMKSQTSFAENDLQNPISYTENFYRTIPRGNGKYRLDNLVPVVGGSNGKISYKTIGKDIEVMNDFRENFSYTMAANIPLNGDLFKIGNLPILLPSIFRLVFRDESLFRSAATLKIVNEYGILDSVVNIDKGSVVGTKNVVYDAETGNPLVTRTYNEFKKPVYSFSYPAWWSQSGMEPAYRNIDLTYSNVMFRNGRIEESPHVNLNNFESGDEIYVSFRNEKGPKESIACASGDIPQVMIPGTEYLIWAVDVTKDTTHHYTKDKNFIFLDRYGKPYTAMNATIRVIRSGKRNMIDASVGSITSLANPVVNDGGQLKIVINNNTNIINASAMEFKEKWRANDMFYAKDTILRTVRATRIIDTTFTPDSSHAFGVYRTRGDTWKDNVTNQTDFSSMRYDFEGGRDFRIDSWLRFNFGSFSPSNTILSASLKLYAHNLHIGTHNYEIHKNANHAQCPDQSLFYKIDPGHGMYNPHISTTRARNDFFLSRMQSTWPNAESCNLWESIYERDLPSGETNIQLVTGTSPSYSALDYSIPVTSMVKAMLRDKYDVTKNYSPAFRLTIAKASKDPARICFWATAGGAKYSVPTLSVKYYSCSNPYREVYKGGIGGAPAVPPTDSVFCITDTVTTICLSRFDQLQMNPYIQGVIGNFRPWRSYVYYGERRESDPTVATDIRKDGVIKDYESFWAFATDSTGKIDTTGSDKWVWNSEITQYNRKGAELENHDPLNRYNCGIYGYQETLPIAIANNSRLRQSGFDGFEDYQYKDEPCEPFCKPYKRHFKPNPLSITDEESHTGKFSARIPIAGEYSFNVPVSLNDSIPEPTLLIDIDTIPKTILKVTPKGIGLKGTYYNSTNFTGTETVRSPEYPDLNFNGSCHSSIFNNPDRKPPPSNINCTNMSAKWTGKIQVITTGNYYFDFGTVDDEGYVVINGVTYTQRTWGGTNIMNAVSLTAGTFYTIEVKFIQKKGNAFVTLKWIEPGSTQPSLIPLKHLYPEGREDLEAGTTQSTTLYCIKPDTVQVIDHKFIDTLNLIPGRRMVASVWMKKGGEDCKCSGYTNNYKVKAPNGTVIGTFAAKERIIEGWQQFEAVFVVPDYDEEGDNYVKFDFPGLETVSYIDDLRIHPFNANMKSFVYDPVTLRLSAELDENNYAAFYEYDDDGGLVRVKKETREGIKTIKETRSAQQKGITTLP